ncbi:MAG TPA: hypothetical protein VHZ03_11485 [Trebonia sp.]|nr:hypothetical protein [Trebonia sp.]
MTPSARVAAPASGLFALTYALIEGHDKGWTSGLILGAFALAALAGAVFLLIEARSAHPMIRCRCSAPGCSAAGSGP